MCKVTFWGLSFPTGIKMFLWCVLAQALLSGPSEVCPQWEHCKTCIHPRIATGGTLQLCYITFSIPNPSWCIIVGQQSGGSTDVIVIRHTAYFVNMEQVCTVALLWLCTAHTHSLWCNRVLKGQQNVACNKGWKDMTSTGWRHMLLQNLWVPVSIYGAITDVAHWHTSVPWQMVALELGTGDNLDDLFPRWNVVKSSWGQFFQIVSVHLSWIKAQRYVWMMHGLSFSLES